MKVRGRFVSAATVAIVASSVLVVGACAAPSQHLGRRLHMQLTRKTMSRVVASGSFAINVPASWVVRAPTSSSCSGVVERSEVITGPMSAALSLCGAPSVTRDTLVVFAHGGPPAVPVLADQPGQTHLVDINGILVTMLSGTAALGTRQESYLLALLDGWANWLLFVVPGKNQSSLRGAKVVLRSVHVIPGRKVSIGRPVPQDLLGTWSHGPDESLTVSSRSRGQEDIGSVAGCEGTAPPLGCHISLEVKLLSSPDRSSFIATVTAVKVYSSERTFVVDPPLTKNLLEDGALAVGTRMTYEGVAPGMLVQVIAAKIDEFPVEWPYWCQYRQQIPADQEIANYCS